MVDWEVTATTIFCEAVDDEVTLIVSGNGAAKCSGQQKYDNSKKDIKKTIANKSKSSGKQFGCKGENCATLKQYRDKMLGEK
jgi:hypothetical protein